MVQGHAEQVIRTELHGAECGGKEERYGQDEEQNSQHKQRRPNAAIDPPIERSQPRNHRVPFGRRMLDLHLFCQQGEFRPRVLYATQGATDPPTVTLFATHELPPTYLRYLERRIREAFALGPTPLKLRVRRRAG